jgi:hypothetical protein
MFFEPSVRSCFRDEQNALFQERPGWMLDSLGGCASQGERRMDSDLISSLTRQVREEVVENYLTERRLLDLQIEDIESQTAGVLLRAQKTGRRLNRLALLMVHPDIRKRLVEMLHIPAHSFWNEFAEGKFSRGVRFIRVRALTDRSKFRKLILESYNRFYERMEKYRKVHESLKLDCQGVNRNIMNFHSNFDLLSILNFLRNLDIQSIEQKQYLGENFTAEEMASVDQKLYIKPISFEKLDLPLPLMLPRPELAERHLTELANEVYEKHQKAVKRLMQ